MSTNEKQVGGNHYKEGEAKCPSCGFGLQHWDISWAFRFDQFQYCISKYIMRRKGSKNQYPTVEDLKKARHHLDKYIECVEQLDYEGGATPEYVNQD